MLAEAGLLSESVEPARDSDASSKTAQSQVHWLALAEVEKTRQSRLRSYPTDDATSLPWQRNVSSYLPRLSSLSSGWRLTAVSEGEDDSLDVGEERGLLERLVDTPLTMEAVG